MTTDCWRRVVLKYSSGIATSVKTSRSGSQRITVPCRFLSFAVRLRTASSESGLPRLKLIVETCVPLYEATVIYSELYCVAQAPSPFSPSEKVYAASPPLLSYLPPA